jgi:hypothetical protein
MISDIADRLTAAARDLPPGGSLGTAADLAQRYGIDEDAMILILVELVGLGHVRREPGGNFYPASPDSNRPR